MKKLISLMVILPLLTTTINNPHAAAAETDSTSYRRGPSLCARLAMAGASILAIASGAYADSDTIAETPKFLDTDPCEKIKKYINPEEYVKTPDEVMKDITSISEVDAHGRTIGHQGITLTGEKMAPYWASRSIFNCDAEAMRNFGIFLLDEYNPTGLHVLKISAELGNKKAETRINRIMKSNAVFKIKHNSDTIIHKHSPDRLHVVLVSGEEEGIIKTAPEDIDLTWLGLRQEIPIRETHLGKRVKRLGHYIVLEEEYKEKEEKWIRTKFPGAFKGHEKSQCLLGIIYRQGVEIDSDFKKAIYWLEKSASQGNARAIRNLASMYFHGEGVKKDLYISRDLYQQAADLGDKESKENLKVFRYE